MRISDWSSDVCSSDLLFERTSVVGGGRRVDDDGFADVEPDAARRFLQALHIAEEPRQALGLLAAPRLLGGIFLDVADQVEAGDEGDEMHVGGAGRVRGDRKSGG